MKEEVLLELLQQASEGNCNAVTLRAIAEEAGEQGATRALKRLGLHDEAARADLDDLRALLSAWREARRSVWRALWGWLTRIVLAGVLAAIALKLGWDART